MRNIIDIYYIRICTQYKYLTLFLQLCGIFLDYSC